jgi:hypothetical protein
MSTTTPAPITIDDHVAVMAAYNAGKPARASREDLYGSARACIRAARRWRAEGQIEKARTITLSARVCVRYARKHAPATV